MQNPNGFQKMGLLTACALTVCRFGIFNSARPNSCGEMLNTKRCFQNFVTSVKLNPLTFMAGTTMSNASSPLVLTGVLICSTFESISIRL